MKEKELCPRGAISLYPRRHVGEVFNIENNKNGKNILVDQLYKKRKLQLITRGMLGDGLFVRSLDDHLLFPLSFFCF